MKILNDYKFVRIIKWLLFYMIRPLVKLENKIYLKIPHKKKKRLFSTSGNISLINALSIINDIGNFDKYEDILIINTGKGRKEFVEKQMEIAKIHKFKKIIIAMNIDSAYQLAFKNIFALDELFLLNHPLNLNRTILLYDNKLPLRIIDEGAASLMDYGFNKIKKTLEIHMHKYLGKLDFLGLDDMNKYSFKPVNVDEFKKIAAELSSKYPISYKLEPEDKAILYCGIYWEVTGLSREKFVEIQSNMLNELLNAGYKILYKPHPRDNEFFGFDKNPNVTFIDSKFPIELYNLDVVAIVSVSSTTSITPAHYWGIPSFSNVVDESLVHNDKDKISIDIVRTIVREYSPNYKELLNFDVKNLTKEELKTQLKKLYDDFIKSKPLLHENPHINTGNVK